MFVLAYFDKKYGDIVCKPHILVSRMDFDSFVDKFDSLDICNLAADAPVDVQRKWTTVEHHGRWMKHYNGGGRPGCPGGYFYCKIK